jgi:hypothetical protein
MLKGIEAKVCQLGNIFARSINPKNATGFFGFVGLFAVTNRPNSVTRTIEVVGHHARAWLHE